eukprot:1141116-Pelagomonas_calceolata.AAC.1
MPRSQSIFLGAKVATLLLVLTGSFLLPPPSRYDAVGVRLHAGHQAVALNAIISELPQSHPLLQAAASGSNGNAENGRMMLREKLGHTPQQDGWGPSSRHSSAAFAAVATLSCKWVMSRQC